MPTTLKQIDAKIATFTTNRAKLQTLGHEIAMMIFLHAAPAAVGPDCMGTGDCTRAIKLAKAMPKSWATQIENWLIANTPIRVVTKNDKCEYDPAYKKLSAEDKLTWWKLEQANTTPFYELEEPESATTILDFAALLKMVSGLSARIEKKIEAGEVKPEDVLSAQAVAVALSGLKVEKVVGTATNDDTKTPKAKAEKPAPLAKAA